MSGDSEAIERFLLPEEPEGFPIELGGGKRMHFRHIRAGTFRMGARGQYPDEEPVHSVKIARDFYLGTYPVTQEQFAVFASGHKNHFPGDRNPADSMSWLKAAEFCDWLTKSGKLRADWIAHLPWEAQWEYACRAGTDT
ncbi:MAG: SUMF1/EgtB/PvdO family nonheme iron enzyme, partial [bacterium]|nr:SUMF1/EgtB/PvdO family nonheme iron enzyme [bacterium]